MEKMELETKTETKVETETNLEKEKPTWDSIKDELESISDIKKGIAFGKYEGVWHLDFDFIKKGDYVEITRKNLFFENEHLDNEKPYYYEFKREPKRCNNPEDARRFIFEQRKSFKNTDFLTS